MPYAFVVCCTVCSFEFLLPIVHNCLLPRKKEPAFAPRFSAFSYGGVKFFDGTVQHYVTEPPHAGLKGEQRLRPDQRILQQAWTESLEMKLHNRKHIFMDLNFMWVANGAKG